MYFCIGDKRRDLDLEFFIKILSIQVLPAHPPTLSSREKCDGFQCPFWHYVDQFYIICLNLVFYPMTHFCGRYGLALVGSDTGIINVTNWKQPP